MEEEKFICQENAISCDPFLDAYEGVNEICHHGLPHWHQNKKLQFVTFRLADSLPQAKLKELSQEKFDFLRLHPHPWDKETSFQFHKKYGEKLDKWLDAGMGSCILKHENIRKIVSDSFYFFNEKKYILHSFVIMPNHVHILLELLEENTINNVLHSWKSFTASQINKLLGRKGNFWFSESFDRIIRDKTHYKMVLGYIAKNPQNLEPHTYTIMFARNTDWLNE